MKLSMSVKKICGFLKENDILLFSESICNYVGLDYKNQYLHFKDSSRICISTALGLALTIDKRVFVFLTNEDVLKNLSDIAHVGALKPKNLFIIILNIVDIDGEKDLFNKLLSPMAMFFNMGHQAFNLTNDFDLKRDELLQTFFDRGQGPVVILIFVDKDKKQYKLFENDIKQFCFFVRDTSLKSSLFDPFRDNFSSVSYSN